MNVYILKCNLYFTLLYEVKGIVGYLAIPVGYVLGKMAMEQVHFRETWSVLVRLRTFNWNRTWLAIDDVPQEPEKAKN